MNPEKNKRAFQERTTNYLKFSLSVLVLIILISAVSATSYTETFDNSEATATYADSSFVGDNTITWNYVESRNEGDYSINENGLMLRGLIEEDYESKIYSETILGGIGDFSVKLKKGFTAEGDRQVELFINGVSKGLSATFDDTITHTFEITGINIEGDIIIRIDNIQDAQVVIDDITWTDYIAEPEPEELNFCGYDNGVSNNPGKLSVKIKDITNKGVSDTKFGDDEEWFPFEEIEVEVEIENKGDDDVDDIVLEWGLYNTDTEEWTIEVDDEDEFNLKDGDEETITITFKIDDNMDEDLDELNGGDFVLYVRATGEVDNDENQDTCASDSEEIEIIIESDFVILDDIEFLETVQCGAEVQITADVWNIGDDEQDDVYVVIYNKELGINEKIELGDIDAFEDEKLNAVIEIPQDADERWYILTLFVYDEDDDLYENDYDEDESEFKVSMQVEGGYFVEPTAVISASLESGGKAGEELIIKGLVTNTGDELTIYSLSVTEYSGWASLLSIEPNTVVLGAGESKEVLVTFNVNEEISGDKMFNLIATSNGEEAVNQPVSVSIEESAPTGLSGITGNVFSEGNWYLWAIGALNILLVIIIIIVAMKVAKK